MSTQSTTAQPAAAESPAIDPSDLIPAIMVPEEYPHLFNATQWNWALRSRDRNGLSHAVVIMGRKRLFISKTRFKEWLSSQVETQS